MTDTQFLAWLKQQDAIRCVLIEVNVKSGGVETTRYLSNKGYTTSPTDTPSNTNYKPVIVGGIKFTETLSIDGNASLSWGDIEIDNNTGDRDSWFDDVWANRAIRVYIGDVRWPRSDFRLVFDGIVAQFDTKTRNRFNLRVSDKMQRLNTPVTENKLGGTTTNADKLLPLCFGECHNISPLLTDAVVNEYQVHDGPIESIIEVRDNGVPVAFTPFLSTGKFRLASQPAGQITVSVQGHKPATSYGPTIAQDGDFASGGFTKWVAYTGTTASVVAGQAVVTSSSVSNILVGQAITTVPGLIYEVTCDRIAGGPLGFYIGNTYGGSDIAGIGSIVSLPNPVVRFTAVGTTTYVNAMTGGASQQVTFDNILVREVYDSAGYANDCATLISRIATSYGNTTSRFAYSELDRPAFSSFVTANPQPVGIYLNERTNVIDTMNQLAVSVGGRVLISRTGLLTIIKLDLPQASPGTTVTATDMVQFSLQVSQLPAVKAGVQIGYCKNWTVQGASNLAAGVPIDHAAMYAEQWLTVTRTDTTTQANYITFVDPVEEDTLLLTNADALAEANRRLGMWKVQRKVFKYEGMPWLMLQTLGASQTVYNSRFGLANGVTGQIVSLATDWLNPHITVEVLI